VIGANLFPFLKSAVATDCAGDPDRDSVVRAQGLDSQKSAFLFSTNGVR